MSNPLANVYGTLLIVRPPVPATCNKAGANYKSEVAYELYSPRQAYDEWLTICEAIVACGGDALVIFEDADDALLDAGDLEVDDAGDIRAEGATEVLGNLGEVMTGRVFAANGPWVTIAEGTLRAVMPRMLSHRRLEGAYYRDLLARIASEGGYELDIVDCPHSWEGMADVAVVGDRVVLTHAVKGHYDQGLEAKTIRTSREGVAFAADFAGVPEDARVYAELVYPHFHGDTVHFGARPTGGPPVLVHYPAGLWGDGASIVSSALGADRILELDRDDAVEQYAGNSRQVAAGVLVPDGVSEAFTDRLAALGLAIHRVPLFELFGKAGGGPACATLYLPANLVLPPDSGLRYSVNRESIRARRERIPNQLRVSPGYFADKHRG